MPILYTSDIFGGDATISVATFANLPVTGKENQRVCITGESALFDVNYPVIVCWNVASSVWQLEQAATTYLKIAAAEFNSGIWAGISDSVGTKPNAIVRDTTYNESWVWNSTGNIFVPSYLGLTTVGNQKKIKGDSTTLESEWTSQIDLPSTLVVDGGNKLLATAASGSGASAFTKFYFTDTAGTGTTNNFYMKCLLQRTNWTRATTGGLDLFIRHDTGNGGRIVEFGDADTSFATIFNGRFTNRATGAGVGYTATANRGDTGWTSETLVQFRVIAGVAAQVKIGTGGWHDIAVSTCRSGAGTLRFEIGVGSNNSVSNIAAAKLRYLQAIRYT